MRFKYFQNFLDANSIQVPDLTFEIIALTTHQ